MIVIMTEINDDMMIFSPVWILTIQTMLKVLWDRHYSNFEEDQKNEKLKRQQKFKIGAIVAGARQNLKRNFPI